MRSCWARPLLWLSLLGLLLLLQLFPPRSGWASTKDAPRKVTPVTSKHWSDEYDRYFRKYSKRYFGPGVDWRWFKAQGIAESGLHPTIKSHAGAVGVMQILPSTFGDIRRNNPHFRSIVEPRWNIAAGIWYDRSLYKYWQKKAPARVDRLALTFASYNAGLGTMQKAWKRSKPDERTKPGRYWPLVATRSPQETRAYVARISELMEARR